MAASLYYPEFLVSTKLVPVEMDIRMTGVFSFYTFFRNLPSIYEHLSLFLLIFHKKLRFSENPCTMKNRHKQTLQGKTFSNNLDRDLKK